MTKTWLSKELTLDLLAITIHSMNKIYERIAADGAEVSPWPVPEDVQRSQASQEIEPTPQPEAPAPEPVVEAAEAPAPVAEPVDYDQLHTQAQQLLRDINLAGGIDWITGTLFPHFGVNSLSNVPKERLPELVTMAETKHGGGAA